MANLTEGRSDRAQIIIVSAFALGVLFVALALILNSAIFTENLASRGETTGGERVINTQQTIERGIGAVLTYENENVTGTSVSRGTLESRLATATQDMGTAITRRSARAGATSTIELTGRTDGTLIRQTNSSRNFTDASGDEDWVLATSVSKTRSVQLNVTKSKIEDCDRFDDCFNLTISDGTDSWALSINNSSGVTVAVEDPGGTTATCDPVSKSNVLIDVTGGTVAGTACPALNFTERPSPDYFIEYENGDQIGGSYSMVVDNSSFDLLNLSSYNSDPTTGEPTATPALYDVSIAYDYQSAAANYSSSVRVAPGESG